jgi:prepilin-type N-terminal cleavage/methylation domain-containing protein
MRDLTYRRSTCGSRGFTLLEMVVVVAILVVVAGLSIASIGYLTADSQFKSTRASLSVIREAIMGGPARAGFYADLGGIPLTLRELFVQGTHPAWNPATKHGWNGPYLAFSTGEFLADDPIPTDDDGGLPTEYGDDDDPALLDAWDRPIVLQIPDFGSTSADHLRHARLVSAGPDGLIQTPPIGPSAQFPDHALCGDDGVLYLQVPDLRPGTPNADWTAEAPE